MKEIVGEIKGSIKITKRKVSRFGKILEKIGLWKLANKVSKVVSVKKYDNLFLNPGRISILKRMAGENTGIITYLAVGNDDTSPSLTDTKLGNETFRKQLTTKNQDELYFKSSTYLATNEANGDIKEVGLYGDDATDTKDSGTIFTRTVVDETKTSGESLTIDYNIEFLTE